MANTNITVVLKPSKRRIGFQYSFAVNGGATGTITTPLYLPVGAQCRVTMQVLTAFTSGGAATINITAGATSLLPQGAVLITDLPAAGNGTGFNDAVTEGSTKISCQFVTAIAGQVGFVIGVAALTAGVGDICIEYETYEIVQ